MTKFKLHFVHLRTDAIAFFRVTTPRFSPAAARYLPIFCVRFFRA